jgi:hypothetical protein
MWVTGLRYDLRIAGWRSRLSCCSGWDLPVGARAGDICGGLPPWFGWVAFIVASVAIGNYFYYQTHHNHIDVFAFGLVDDDTCAVLANMWQDYPVIKGYRRYPVGTPPVWFSYRVRSMTLRPGRVPCSGWCWFFRSS